LGQSGNNKKKTRRAGRESMASQAKKPSAGDHLRRSKSSGAVVFVLCSLAAVFAAPAAFAQASTTQVSSGGHHTCAVSPTGGLTCWGRNLNGELGDATNTNNGSPTQVSGLTSGIVQVTTGGNHTCALTSGGAVKCWGLNDYGQLGQGGGNRNTPGDVTALPSGVIQIEAGELHTCALTAAGGVKCWGNNSLGQLGDTTNTFRSAPADVSGLTSGVKSIASGDSHTCAVLTDGTAKCWGLNEDGQLGNGVNTSLGVGVTSPVTVLASGPPTPITLTGIARLATGRTHTCALMDDGSVNCWGRNLAGQLGRGTITQRELTPGVASGLGSGVARIELGFEHSCAVLTNGQAQCWGKNIEGEVGNGDVNVVDGVATPTIVHGLASGVADVSAGSGHTCWLTQGGSVRCSGINSDGRLGDGTTGGGNVLAATNVVGLTAGVAATQIASGGAHSCQVNAGGVMCWGRNTEGQLGNAGNTDSPVPVPVSGLAGITAVATGAFHACALGSGGGLKCWGANGAEQLGVDGREQQHARRCDRPHERRRRGRGRRLLQLRAHHGRRRQVLGRQHPRPARQRQQHRRQNPRRCHGSHDRRDGDRGGARALPARCWARAAPSAGAGTRRASSATARSHRTTATAASTLPWTSRA
jgi:alpha-tubulin suppressor-like RCC1 family protein